MRLLSQSLSSLTSTATLLLLLLSSSPLALADVQFTAPAAGAAIPAGAITVTWTDGGGAPALSALKTYQIQLVVGGNDEDTQIPVATITTTGKFAAGNSVTGTVSPAVAGNTANGYFLKMIAVATEGGTLTAYSERFSMTGMTGTTPANAVQAVAALKGSTQGPKGVNDVTPNAGADPAETTAAAVPPKGANIVPGAPAAAGMPYSLQTAGSVKYAPMQGIPPTKITQKNTAPLFPTSAFTIAKTWNPPAQFISTATAPQTFSVQSVMNTIAAQSQPSDDMAKFLARWKD